MKYLVCFLSSGVTRACLNAVGKMPVRRDVLLIRDARYTGTVKLTVFIIFQMVRYHNFA